LIENPQTILFFIQYYQRLLERNPPQEARQLVSQLLTKAEAELALAEAERASGNTERR